MWNSQQRHRERALNSMETVRCGHFVAMSLATSVTLWGDVNGFLLEKRDELHKKFEAEPSNRSRYERAKTSGYRNWTTTLNLFSVFWNTYFTSLEWDTTISSQSQSNSSHNSIYIRSRYNLVNLYLTSSSRWLLSSSLYNPLSSAPAPSKQHSVCLLDVINSRFVSLTTELFSVSSTYTRVHSSRIYSIARSQWKASEHITVCRLSIPNALSPLSAQLLKYSMLLAADPHAAIDIDKLVSP